MLELRALLDRQGGSAPGFLLAAEDGQPGGGLLPRTALAADRGRAGGPSGQLDQRRRDAGKDVGHLRAAEPLNGRHGVREGNAQSGGVRVVGDGRSEHGLALPLLEPVQVELVVGQRPVQQADSLAFHLQQIGVAAHVELLVRPQNLGQFEDAARLFGDLLQGNQLQRGVRRHFLGCHQRLLQSFHQRPRALRRPGDKQRAIHLLGQLGPLAADRGRGEVVGHGADRVARDVGVAGGVLRLPRLRSRNGVRDVEEIDAPREQGQPFGVQLQRADLVQHLEVVDHGVEERIADGHAV